MTRQRYSDDAPYGPGNSDYEHDVRVQNELEAESQGEEAAKEGRPAACMYVPWSSEYSAWHRGWVRENIKRKEKRMDQNPGRATPEEREALKPITETPVTNGAYNSALNDVVVECQKLVGEFALQGVVRDSDIGFARALLQRIEALRLA